jgi:hypothetical protein
VEVNEDGQERQHFLLRSEAVTLGEFEIARWSDDQCYAAFEAMRFADNGGKPFCPHCGTTDAYRLTISRRPRGKDKSGPPRQVVLYKCRVAAPVCGKQFSVTSGTIFDHRKMSIRDIVGSLLVFADAVSGEAALRLRRALKCSYKTAFALEGKLREAIAKSRSKRLLHDVVEADGTTIGGHSRKAREKVKGKDAYVGNPSQLSSILAIRERRADGETRVAVFGHEAHYRDPVAGTDFIRDNVVFGTTMVSDEGFSLGYIGPHQTVKHKAGYKIKGVHTNGVEGFFSRVKRAENGVYYGIVGPYIDLYAQEIAWREDYRRTSNGELWRMLLSAVTRAPISRRWAGYWQRWQTADAARRSRPIPCGPRPSAAI